MNRRHLFLAVVSLFLIACSPRWQLDILDAAKQQTSTLQPADLAHRKLVINFWAAWCKPCLQEIPELDRFAAAHHDKAVVLAMNFDRLQDTALREAIQKANITYPSLITDPSTVFKLPDIDGLPTTLILDDKGNVVKILAGAQTQQTLEAALEL